MNNDKKKQTKTKQNTLILQRPTVLWASGFTSIVWYKFNHLHQKNNVYKYRPVLQL